MRLNSTFKASCYALAFAALSLTGLTAGAQCGVITQNFNTSNGGFTGTATYSTSGNLVATVNNTSATTVTVTSPLYLNSQPNGSTVIGFSLGGYVKNTTYQINIYNSNNVLFVSTPITNANINNGNTVPYICRTITDPSLANGIGLRYEIIITVANPGNNGNNILEITFDDFSLGNIEAIILPVNFRAVTAAKNAKGVQVKWDVFEEIDVKEYQVEKTTNGTTFTKIGSVDATGAPSYYFADAAPASGVNIYRIKSVDIDGKYKYSTIARINLSNALSLKAFPLPAADAVTIEHGIGARGTLQLSTADGRALKAVNVAEGTSQTTLDVSALQRGLYLVRFVKENGATETLKIIKQ